MHRHEFDAVRSLLACKLEDRPAIPVRVTAGKHKGRDGVVAEVTGNHLVVQVGDAAPSLHAYHVLLRLDAAGQPVVEAVRDLTGREITEGAVVCYSVPAGNQSHALEIGRVLRFNPSGSLTVRPVVRNGQVIGGCRQARERVGVQTARCLLLPLDTAMVTTWVLSDFALFKDGAMLED